MELFLHGLLCTWFLSFKTPIRQPESKRSIRQRLKQTKNANLLISLLIKLVPPFRALSCFLVCFLSKSFLIYFCCRLSCLPLHFLRLDANYNIGFALLRGTFYLLLSLLPCWSISLDLIPILDQILAGLHLNNMSEEITREIGKIPQRGLLIKW
jgi:hypothetical protein